MKRVVLDTNVIISAAFGGIPLEAVHYASLYTVFINDTIEKELFGVIEKLKDKLSPSLLKEARNQVETIVRNAKKVECREIIKICRDPKDNAYLELAKSVDANFLITGDKDLLSLSKGDLKKAGIDKLEIITPKEFIDKFQTLEFR